MTSRIRLVLDLAKAPWALHLHGPCTAQLWKLRLLLNSALPLVLLFSTSSCESIKRLGNGDRCTHLGLRMSLKNSKNGSFGKVWAVSWVQCWHTEAGTTKWICGQRCVLDLRLGEFWNIHICRCSTFLCPASQSKIPKSLTVTKSPPNSYTASICSNRLIQNNQAHQEPIKEWDDNI